MRSEKDGIGLLAKLEYFYYYTLIYVPTAKIDKKLERPTKTQKNS